MAVTGLLLMLAVSAVHGAETAPFGMTGYPGAAPGPARIECKGDSIAVCGGALTATFKLTGQGLTLQSVRDEQAGRDVQWAGELFQVVLAGQQASGANPPGGSGGQRYAASALAPQGAAKVSDLPADPKSARLAGRIPGKQVELALTSADGRLRVTWRAIVRDGSNYVRQEIDVTAEGEDLKLQEVLWLDMKVPGARTAGSVDGSVVVADNFFLGGEDPHALNGAAAGGRKVAAWTSDDLEYGKVRTRAWPLDASLLREGANEFQFRYERGPHRLDVWRAAILEDGQPIAKDEHHGRTGVAHVDNVYAFTLGKPKPGAKYELQADLSTDPDFKLPAGGKLESFGQVLLLGGEGTVACRLSRPMVLGKGRTLTTSLVIGASPAGQLRRGFLYYLERERAHPYRPYLHYNSWYDTAWDPFALNEANCLEAIRACGENLVRRHAVVLDGLVFDDGWDDPKTLWQFHSGFPKGFAPLADLCRQYDTRLGVWLSPFGGYGEPRNKRLQFGRQQGYETNATGFSMAGPKYYAAFRRACVDMIRTYGVNHFKFDGIAAGMMASGGEQYLLDTEAMRRLMLELRKEDPNLYVNLTTGSWPSPFWLRFADSLWRQGGDMGLAGKGPRQQQWLTYRDQEVYRNIVRRGPLFPLSSLMTQGVAYSRRGSAGEKTFNSAGFKDDVRAFFGAGTSLQELYIQPGRLTADDWAVLAEAAKWSRANADVLLDTHWISGDPGKGEPYGYASWSARKGIVMVRNPDDRPREFDLDVGPAFALPPGAATRYALRSPWADDAARPALQAEAGKPLKLALKPFEVMVFDATPQP